MKDRIKIAPDEDLRNSNLIVGLSFGLKADGSPGLSNGYLAEIIEELYQKYQKPVILQKEIAEALSILGYNIPIEAVIKEHRECKKNSNEKKYLDTSEALIQVREVCRVKGWNIIILVAHQDHLPRSIKTAKNLGFTVNAPFIEDCPYDRESSQKWTRNKWKFKFHEIAANLFYMIKGYI